MNQSFRNIVGEMTATLRERFGTEAPGQLADTAVFVATPEGMIAAIDNEVHLGSAHEMVISFLGPNGIPMEEGDAVLANDPYLGSPHVQDFYLLAPVHFKERLCAYLGAKTHLPDVGGDVRGGFNPRAEEIWAEGVRITPLKICRGGRVDSGILNMVLLNTRTPDIMRAGLESLIAAVESGRKEVVSCLRDSKGTEDFLNEAGKMIGDMEKDVREIVSFWPSGEYRGNCLVEDNLFEAKGANIETKLTVGEARIEIDFSSNLPQLKAPINSPRGNTLSFALLPFFPFLHMDAFMNAGIWRVITVKTKPGTLVDPVLPAPTSFSPFHVGLEVATAVRAAAEKFLPEEGKDRLASLFDSLVNWHSRG